MSLITGHLAGAERDAIIRRTSAGRERIRREKGYKAEGNGKHMMPRGVEFDHETKRWSYAYPGAAQVRQAFDLFLAGETNLTQIGRQTGIGERHSFSVASLLRQPLYMGIYRVDRKWLKTGRWIPRPPEDCYEHTVIDPPLVTPAEFARAQARLSEIAGNRPKTPAMVERPVDCAGFAHCARCGARLMVLRHPRSSNWMYRCARDHRGRKNQCDLGEFVAQKVDTVASAAIEAALSDADTVIRLVREGMERSAVALPSGGELERRRISLDQRRRRVVDLYEDGGIDLAEFRKRVSGIDADRNAVAVMMEAAGPPEIDESACVEVAYAFARWRRLGRSRRRKLLESFGVRFWVEKNGRGKCAVARVVRLEIGSLSNAAIYKLTGNLVNNNSSIDTIQLVASLVTLDLNGFIIAGPSQCSVNAGGVTCSGSGAGGSVSTINGRTNCPYGNTVRNGTILGAAGNAVNLCASSRVEDVTIVGANSEGIFVNEGSLVVHCNVVLAGTIAIWAPSSSVFDSTVRDSGRAGDSFISGISGFTGLPVAVRGNQLFRLFQNEYFENQRSLGPNSCDGNAC